MIVWETFKKCNFVLKYTELMKLKLFLFALATLFLSSVNAQGDKSFTPEQKFLRTMQLLRTAYVDSVDVDRVVEIGIRLMLEHLDQIGRASCRERV